MANDMKAVHAATKQALAAVRKVVLAEAEEIRARAGEDAILIGRLADRHGVAALTVKRWLIKAGFDVAQRTGRPTFEQVLQHDGLLEVYQARQAR